MDGRRALAYRRGRRVRPPAGLEIGVRALAVALVPPPRRPRLQHVAAQLRRLVEPREPAADGVELLERLLVTPFVEGHQRRHVLGRRHVGPGALREVSERGIAVLLLDLPPLLLPPVVVADALDLVEPLSIEVPHHERQRIGRPRLAEPVAPRRLQRFPRLRLFAERQVPAPERVAPRPGRRRPRPVDLLLQLAHPGLDGRPVPADVVEPRERRVPRRGLDVLHQRGEPARQPLARRRLARGPRARSPPP